MIHAEKASCKKHTNTYAWSPQLIQAVQGERFWKLMLKCSKGLPVAPSALLRTKTAAGITSSTAVSITEIIDNLRAAAKSRKQAQAHHKDLRDSY